MIRMVTEQHSLSAADRRARRTALHYAAVDGDLRLVESLVADGADVDAQDSNGMTALHFAAQESRRDIVVSLLASGAEVDLVDRHGNTALSTAVYNYKDDDSRECVTLLMSAGANRHQVNNHGVSPEGLALMVANYNARKFFQ